LNFTGNCDKIESTYRLFTAADDDRDLAKFCPQYFNSLEHLSVESFRSRVERWVTEENVHLFAPSPLEVVTRRLCDLRIDSIKCHQLNDIASYLIAKGAELHDPCLLGVAIASVAHPLDSQTIGTRFLEMLAASNVEVAEYLASERQHNLEVLLNLSRSHLPWPYTPDPRVVKLYINEEQPCSISWDWWVDPKEEAFTVLHEFRHFGQAENFVLHDWWSDKGTLYWPFIYPNWTRGLSVRANEEEKALLKRIQQRSDRRWEKKMIKQAKIQVTYRKPMMPGTWIH
jgi:hypothetical protein